MKYAIILFLVLFGCELNSKPRDWHEWKDTEKAEYIAFTLLNYTDFRQTELCVSKYPECMEGNPIYGATPNDATIAAGFLITQISYYYLIKYDNPYRWSLFGLKLGIVISNDYNGVRIKQVW